MRHRENKRAKQKFRWKLKSSECGNSPCWRFSIFSISHSLNMKIPVSSPTTGSDIIPSLPTRKLLNPKSRVVGRRQNSFVEIFAGISRFFAENIFQLFGKNQLFRRWRVFCHLSLSKLRQKKKGSRFKSHFGWFYL